MRWSVALLTSLAACSGARPDPVPPPRATGIPRIEGPSELARGPFATLRSKRFHFAIPLPDGAQFTMDEAPPSSFFRATHLPTGSLLYVKKWRLPTAATRDACRAELELTLPKPLTVDRRRGTALDPRELSGPGPFRTQVETWVRVDKPSSPDDPGSATGWLLAYGTNVRECFGFAFATQAAGPASGSIVGDRLGAIAGSSLVRLRFEDATIGPLEDRVIPPIAP